MSCDALFQPLAMGALALPHRVLMAPLTRSRAQQPGDVPWKLNAQYYTQRAGAGLIFTEATQVSPQGKGYAYTPGIHSEEQVAGWRQVTDAVHAAGGRMALQLWHVGRISHTALQPGGEAPVAPSAIKAKSQTYIDGESGMVDVAEPRALDLGELPGIVGQYRVGADNARRAGFDAVQVHCANGYLMDQFLRDGTNQRSDAYGGSVDNRVRLPLEVVEAVAGVWGPDRVGVRISPHGSFNDMHDSDPYTTFTTFARRLGELGIAHLEVVEAFAADGRDDAVMRLAHGLREAFPNTLIINGGLDAAMANEAIASGRADAATFGKLFIANPDLPERFRRGAPLNEWDSATFYGGTEKGYTDYPSLEEAAAG